MSGIFDSESLLEIDLARLLRVKEYETYTNFIISGVTETFTNDLRKHKKITAKLKHQDEQIKHQDEQL